MKSVQENDVDPGSATQGRAPAWRDAVRAAAQEAALTVDKARWDKLGCTAPLFAYRWEHVQAVVRLAIKLAELTGADREIVEAAAWLHDVGKGSGSEDHGRAGAVAARTILVQTGFSTYKIEAVADAIGKHVGYARSAPVEPLEAAVLWDADKLTWLGATSVLHIASSAVGIGQVTTAQLLDRLSDVAWREGIARSLHTAPARAAGRKRVEAYRAFYQQAAREFSGDDLLLCRPRHDRREGKVRARSIRVTARCLFRHEGQILTISAQDPDKPEPHYSVPGGGVEFGETSEQALCREMREELGAEIADPDLLFVSEEIFVVQGQTYHVIVFLYEGRFVDPGFYARPVISYVEGPEPRKKATWMPASVFVSGKKRLVPERLVGMLQE